MSEHHIVVPKLKPVRSSNRLRHGHTSRDATGRKVSPTYCSWEAMRARCKYANRDNADRYHAKGIRLCVRWNSFDLFLADMGLRPAGTTLDRLDSSKGYTPKNCRWATPRQQARNTRKSKLTLDTAVQVAALRLLGIHCVVIAEVFGISESLPREIVKGRCWPDALAAARRIVEGLDVRCR